MRILGIDPGLDGVGWALVERTERRPVTPRDYRAALIAHGSFHTPPSNALEVRLAQIHQALGEVVRERVVDLAIVELPRIENTYSRNAKNEEGRGFMAGTMAPLNRAIGAILLSLQVHGIRVQTMLASPMEKKLKSAWVVNIWPELGNKKSNADQRDAIHFACAALTRPSSSLAGGA